MRRKVIGVIFAVALAVFLFWVGAEAGTSEEDATITVEVSEMVIQELPVEVKVSEVEQEEPKAEKEYKLFDIGLSEDEQIFMRVMCEASGVDYPFALALMKSESDFRWVEGDKNLKYHAIGYFQISTINAERMESQYGLDIYDQLDNIEAGIRIIAELQESFKDGYKGYFDTTTCVVMGYKCGLSKARELMSDGIVLASIEQIKADMEAFK